MGILGAGRHAARAAQTAHPANGQSRSPKGYERDAATGRESLRVVVGRGKTRFVIELSAARLTWAKRPIIQVMFQTEGDDLAALIHEGGFLGVAFAAV